MKLYESAYTYFPFLYLYVLSIVFGTLYHNTTLTLYQPYIILVFTLINTGVFYVHDTDVIIKHAVHRHIWKTVTLSIFGIMMNNVHTEMMRDFHFTSDNVNLTVSAVYVILMWITTYYYEYIGGGIILHLTFAFFPLMRVWQVNLYMYVVYTTLAVILMYRRIKVSSLHDISIHVNPVIKFFMYLRLHDYLVVLGVFQIYLEYYQSTLPEKRAVEHISHMIEVERQRYRKDIMEEERSIVVGGDGGDDDDDDVPRLNI
jgi:hypothetical protein